MSEKRQVSVRALVLSVVGAVLGTLLLVVLLAWLVLGKQGLALVYGWGVARAQFVGDYEPDAAADASLEGLVTGLGDRWSYYMDAKSYADSKQSKTNTYVGIGVTVTYTDERGLLIAAVRRGGPAEAAGLTAGEIITAVDGTSIAGDGRSAATDLIRGRAGTEVTLTVLGTDGAERQVAVTRAAISTDPVKYELLENGVGYIALSNFNDSTARLLNAAVDDLVAQGAEALVFDMRNNGGGYVSELTQMLDHLLPEGPIFRLSSRSGKEKVTWSDASCVDLPMAVLVNAGTYSAAEFFAAQLRESVGAFVVGVETSGKGYSQQTFPLPNGGGLNISTAKYTTGAGVSLVGTGVTLDAEVDLSEDHAYALWAGSLDHSEDEQLQAALALLGK